ncbi:MAG TPA: 23S rRNA (pseudouridine(1915)-N(3))-methyltransferase RlmH [Candidatus Saccharimonadales bacterium]|nr:23S rRNA (pseudouridine(1915)-N(3))-methyltransferase RlmH [Candidatus Saccharimonadales bacterium]
MIQIFAVGKKHESWVASGIERYEKRLKKPFNTEWQIIPHSSRESAKARQDESERLLARLKVDDFVVLLDERGTIIDSPALSHSLEAPLAHSRRVVMIIGGAYGVTDRVHERADLIWSLSKLVFPHQLVRLILVEQLYRAQEIIGGHAYHHE